MTPQINNVKFTDETKSKSVIFWENVQLLGLALTIIGQITVGMWFLVGQGLWLVANIIAVIRDFILGRPSADKIKDIVLTAITASLIILNVFGGIF